MIAFDRVAQYIDSTGTDQVMTLGTAVPTYITAEAAAAVGSIPAPWQVPYLIVDGAGWELGIGTISDTGYLTRSKVFRSSSGGNRINVTGDPDPAIVYVVQIGLAAASVTHSALADDQYSGLDPALGCTVAPGVLGAVGIGSQSRIDANGGAALGAETYSRVEGATALGAKADARVIGAVSCGLNDSADVVWVGRAQTYDDTPELITRDGIGMVPWSTGVYVLDALVCGRRTAPSAAAYGARITGVVMRTSGGTPVIIGTPTKTDIALSSGATATCALVVDEDNNAVAVQVTGGETEEWMWTASIRAAEQAGF